jgi:hypothetical protein
MNNKLSQIKQSATALLCFLMITGITAVQAQTNITISGGTVKAAGQDDAAGIGGSTANFNGAILIYGENTKVTAASGASSTTDIGTTNVFVALTPGNFVSSKTTVNTVTFQANPASTAAVSATSTAAPFSSATIDVLAAPTVAGKALSVYTTLTTQEMSFALAGGYANSPISLTGTQLMAPGAAVAFYIPVITIGTQPAASTTFFEGNISGSLTVAATILPNGTLAYQWYENTANSNTGGTAIPGATNANFTIPTTLTAGTYYYYCVVSGATLASVTATPVTTNVAAVTVNVTPSVSISANPASPIFAGTPVTFTATPTNGGATPTYQWQVNGSNVGTNSSTHIYTPANGDVITCDMTSNDPAASPATATSNTITMTVIPAPVPPTITGDKWLTLKTGYAATSTDAYTITGTQPVTVTVTKTDTDKITWNNTAKKLNIAPGLAAGKYEVTLRASNSAGSHTLTFTLTVEEHVYWIEIPAFVGGTVSSNPQYISEAGGTVTLTVTPDEGYELASISVTDMSNPNIFIPLSGTGLTGSTGSLTICTFTMPAHHVKVTASFLKTGWEAALALIEKTTFTVTQQQANTESDLRYRLATLINELIKETGFVVSYSDIVIFAFTPAASGNDGIPAGTNGAFQFRVTPANVRNSAYSSGTITASPVSNDGIYAASLKAYTQNGVLYVSGLTEGKTWQVYNMLGTLVYQGDANTDKAEIRLPGRGVYIVTHENRTVKVNN